MWAGEDDLDVTGEGLISLVAGFISHLCLGVSVIAAR
jgi:hypothetical protein